jgi:hypothetical protein
VLTGGSSFPDIDPIKLSNVSPEVINLSLRYSFFLYVYILDAAALQGYAD